jgi:hypothetical protein
MPLPKVRQLTQMRLEYEPDDYESEGFNTGPLAPTSDYEPDDYEKEGYMISPQDKVRLLPSSR